VVEVGQRSTDSRHVFDVNEALHALIARGGSDLHIKAGNRPLIRVDGLLQAIDPAAENLSPADTDDALAALLKETAKREEFMEEGEVDFSYVLTGIARFRINAFRQRGSIAIVARAIPFGIKTIDELALPPVIRDLAEEERGIILVTGTTGSGKSTTLAAMIDHMNERFARHIVTVEDPIEFLHRDKRSSINQREVGQDTKSFGRALRRVLRQDPDVILIGEMRDEETVHTALSAAETGHLVLSTVHSVDAAETVNRIIDVFPPHMHAQVRAMVAGTLKGVISQRLVRAKDGGRVATCEVMRMTGRVRDFIMDPAQTGKLGEVVADGGFYGMQTFDQALYQAVTAGKITMETAMAAASRPHDFKLLVQGEGRVGTTMEDVIQEPDEEEPPNGNGNGNGGSTERDPSSLIPGL
jgi:twitching motility protein PilT